MLTHTYLIDIIRLMNNPEQTAIRINKQLASQFMEYAKANNRSMTQQLEVELRQVLDKAQVVS